MLSVLSLSLAYFITFVKVLRVSNVVILSAFESISLLCKG